MAGRPKTRERRAAEAEAAGGIPDALTEPAPPTRAHARASAYASEPQQPPRNGFAGVQARTVVDATAAGELGELARVLRIGTRVRIERVRPSWAAGYLEELTLDRAGIGELLEHLQEEYGGKRYRVTVLMASGQPGYEATISIAGPPLDQGELIDRDEWNGQPSKRELARERARNGVPAAAMQPHPPTPMGDMVKLFELILKQTGDSSERQLASVKELVSTSAAQNQDLIEALVESRTTERKEKSLASQLGELVEAQRAIARAGKVFGAAAPAQSGGGDDDVVSQAVREAGKDFIAGVIRSEIMGGKPAARATPPLNSRPAQATSRVRQRPTPSIPDAMSHPGHGQPTQRN